MDLAFTPKQRSSGPLPEASTPDPALTVFEARSHKRTFYSAPQSVRSFVAALLEPAVTVLTLLALTLMHQEPLGRPVLTLCLLAFALTFPGRDHFRDNPLAAGVDIVTSWISLVAILALFGYATRSLHLFEPAVLFAWVGATPLLQWFAVCCGRTLVRRLAARASARRSAVVVGTGALGVRVGQALAESDDLGVDFLGYFDDRSDKRVHEGAAAQRLGNLGVLGAHVRDHGIREVYITLPLGVQPRITRLLEELQGTTASLFYVPDIFGISIIQGRLQDLRGVAVVGLCETPFTGTNELLKRVSDLLLATLILVLIAPLMLVLAIGVKLSSPGPVIFRQRRNGLDGGEIEIYKFRSMTTQDNGQEVRQATKQDPRITRFGAYLRRSSLDELPQFINVLQGRMSIVGPRPHAVVHNEQYRKLIKAYMVRHKVKPGITGWAQVHGHRGETQTIEKMQARIEYDLEYLRNWSLGLDLQIIVRTIRLVFFDRQAY
jgi:putative colanic acid biosynthesis UDP-glucose lipid carrier transferase